MSEIRLERVTKLFAGDVRAVDEVSLTIASGEFMVLVGPSGCGKSTLLRMVAGLEEVSDGEIWIGDREVSRLAPRDRDIAMVFQNYALYPHYTVAKNLAYGLKVRKTPKAEIDRRVAEVARMLGLEELMQRRPGALSGGQRQRVAMGRAIVREPVAFLMDEPLSNLDAKLRVDMRAELARLHERLSVTTIYVTHDQVEAMTLGTRVAVMRAGMRTTSPCPLAMSRCSGRNPIRRSVPRGRWAAAWAALPESTSLALPSMRSSPSVAFTVAKFMAGEPMKPATKTLTGPSYSSCGVPTCCSRPSFMTAIRSPMVMASTWSCVT